LQNPFWKNYRLNRSRKRTAQEIAAKKRQIAKITAVEIPLSGRLLSVEREEEDCSSELILSFSVAMEIVSDEPFVV
jgi:hypothetical protein